MSSEARADLTTRSTTCSSTSPARSLTRRGRPLSLMSRLMSRSPARSRTLFDRRAARDDAGAWSIVSTGGPLCANRHRLVLPQGEQAHAIPDLWSDTVQARQLIAGLGIREGSELLKPARRPVSHLFGDFHKVARPPLQSCFGVDFIGVETCDHGS